MIERQLNLTNTELPFIAEIAGTLIVEVAGKVVESPLTKRRKKQIKKMFKNLTGNR